MAEITTADELNEVLEQNWKLRLAFYSTLDQLFDDHGVEVAQDLMGRLKLSETGSGGLPGFP